MIPHPAILWFSNRQFEISLPPIRMNLCPEQGGCSAVGASCLYFVPGSIRVGLHTSEQYPEVDCCLHFLPSSIRVGLRMSERCPEVDCCLYFVPASTAPGQKIKHLESPAQDQSHLSIKVFTCRDGIVFAHGIG